MSIIKIMEYPKGASFLDRQAFKTATDCPPDEPENCLQIHFEEKTHTLLKYSLEPSGSGFMVAFESCLCQLAGQTSPVFSCA